MNNKKIILITGASSGIGQATAMTLSNMGFIVYGTSRKVKKEDLGYEMIELDITNEESIKKAITYILNKEGRIDILINNAGMGIAGAIEDTSLEEAKKQFDVNFFGMHSMCKSILPIMRKQKNGLIINISSLAGIISIPYQSMYSASKYAIEAYSEALRIETRPFGIKVSLIEPGDTKTGFTDSRYFVRESDDSVYKEYFTKAINTMIEAEKNGKGPDTIVKAIVKIIMSKNPPIRITPGFENNTFRLLKKFLPAKLSEFIVSKIY